jgi:hypothetical protein
LETDLIIAGFVDKSVEIYQTDAKGNAWPVEDFAVIGEGAYLAEATLMRRAQSSMRTLDETLYNVFEAKKYAESVGSVGPATSLMVLHTDGECRGVNSNVRVQLKSLFSEYGPKALPKGFKLGEPFFVDKKPEPDSAQQTGGNVVTLGSGGTSGSGTTQSTQNTS